MCTRKEPVPPYECSCENCKQLVEDMTECDICAEPFWYNGVSSCYTCGSLICFSCAQKLVTCPFCRVSVVCPWQRNVAIEKLIKKLKLPCRYSRRGCPRWLQHTNEDEHEQTCEYSPMICPFAPSCKWRGDFEMITCHLRQTHDLELLNGDKVTVEISSLQKKIQETEDHLSKYVVMLQCYSAFFCCKIVLYQGKLKIVFTEVSSKEKNRKYGAWLELLDPKPIAKGILEISSNVKCSKELDINFDNLLSKTCSSSVENGNLKIRINIKPLNNNNNNC